MKKEKESPKLEIRDGGFLQSKQWADFQKTVGNKVLEMKFPAEFSSNVIEYVLPVVGSYFFVTRGPIFLKKGVSEKCAKELLETAKKRGAGWIRIEPQTKKELEELKKAFEKLGSKVVKAKKNHQPAQTLMLDLKKTEEELLAKMKAKTRYNIRLATKKGVIVEKSRDSEAVDAFVELSQETAKRDAIVIHPEKYYRKMIETIPAEMLSLYVAKFEGKIVGVALVSFSGSVATYLHGASSNENRNVMAPHLLQWTAICDAKKAGFSKYDFGGTKIEKDKDGKIIESSWQGITKFKVGFSPDGKPIEFPGCWDVIVDTKRYYTYLMLQSTKDLLWKLKLKIKKNVKMA
jgi:peptidoglycan pentaglycine glycine transferase (the first glycine)